MCGMGMYVTGVVMFGCYLVVVKLFRLGYDLLTTASSVRTLVHVAGGAEVLSGCFEPSAQLLLSHPVQDPTWDFRFGCTTAIEVRVLGVWSCSNHSNVVDGGHS